jgi:hypothetical protein
VKPVGKFSGQGDPLATSNGTTPTTMVEPAGGGVFQPGVDPKSGRVLDTGNLSGQVGGWEIRDGTKTVQLDSGVDFPALAWGPDGSIVVVHPNQVDQPFVMVVEGSEAPNAVIEPEFQLPAGTYWQEFNGVRGSTALIGLAGDRAHESPYLGPDELVAVDLPTARTAVLVPDSPGLTGLHVAGWITAP